MNASKLPPQARWFTFLCRCWFLPLLALLPAHGQISSVALTLTPGTGSVSVGQSVTMTAQVSPPGSEERVFFMVNNRLVGAASSSPYQLKVQLPAPGSYAFRAVASTTSMGEPVEVTSPTQAVNVTGFTPSVISAPELVLWLRADQGLETDQTSRVTRWNDSSLQHHVATPQSTASAPFKVVGGPGGNPAVRFDGVDDGLVIPDSAALSFGSAMTCLAVVRVTDYSVNHSIFAKTAGPAGNIPASADFYLRQNSGLPRLFRGNGQAGLDFADGSVPVTAGATTYHLIGFRTAAVPGSPIKSTITHFYGTQDQFTETIAVPLADRDTPLHIGNRLDGVTKLKGDLCELMLYNTALSTDDLRMPQAHLSHKYALGHAFAVSEPPSVTVSAVVGGVTHPAGSTITIPPGANSAVTLQYSAQNGDGVVTEQILTENGESQCAVLGAGGGTYSISLGNGRHRLQWSAVDNLNQRVFAPPFTIDVLSEPITPLPAASDLVLWLRGDQTMLDADNRVMEWRDLSGQGNDAVQPTAAARPSVAVFATPLRPAVVFDGVDDFFTVPSSPTMTLDQFTAVYVASFDDFTSFQGVFAKTAGPGGNIPAPVDYYLVPPSGVTKYLAGDGGTTFGSVTGRTAPVTQVFQILSVSGVTNPELYVNDLPDWSDSLALPTADLGSPFYLGGRADGVTKLKGKLAEFILYDRRLTEDERQQLTAVLRTRYGIPRVTLPALSVQRSTGNSVTVSWDRPTTVEWEWALQSSPTLTGPWSPVPGVINSSVTVPIQGTKFFRLVR